MPTKKPNTSDRETRHSKRQRTAIGSSSSIGECLSSNSQVFSSSSTEEKTGEKNKVEKLLEEAKEELQDKENLQNDEKPNDGLAYYIIEAKELLYHSTKEKKTDFKVDKTRTMYFYTSSISHNPNMIKFVADKEIYVVDLLKLENIKIIHEMMMKSSDENLAKDLFYKTKAMKDKAGTIISVGGFKSESREIDKGLENWFKENGFEGWRGQLGDKTEIMLTNTNNVSMTS